MTIYDLRRKAVRHLVEGREKYPLGKYPMVWGGGDDGGRLVSPRMYLVVIRVHSNWEDAKNKEAMRRVYVAY